ncbi:AMP-binding protein [Actinomycetaceae bacterium TAE3-ERU4]|nr:AMP-binding protein [Actinomycetaceae bacterium TAE3-ERU4]
MPTVQQQAWKYYDKGVPHEIPIPDKSLYFLLENTAKAYPKNIAIDYYGATWSYEEIKNLADKAAQVLYQAGVRRGDYVALALPNCPQHFVVFYALMRLGAVASEHNPLAPPSQIHEQLRRHGGKVAVVWEKCAASYEGIAESGGTVFTVDIAASLPLKLKAALRLPLPKAKKLREKMQSPTPSWALSWDREVKKAKPIADTVEHAQVTDTAVILHTGGTNGTPKSVPLTHLNIGANSNQNTFWVWKLNKGAETFWSLLPYFHAFGLTFFLVAAVSLAATQIVIPTFDVKSALRAHQKRPVTFFVGVPPMFKRIAEAANAQNIDITTIKYAISGGMPLSLEIAHLWEKTTKNYIIEGYGMSETSPTMCGSPLTPERRHASLGLPFPSTQIKLVNPQNPSEEVADGQPGEILVKGPQVFGGYLSDDTNNAKAFHDGWFRTGDIARNENGFLVMADRLKELIITSGFNVYPSEVEQILRKHPDVKEVAVVGLPDEVSGEIVTAAIVTDNPDLTVEELQDFASKDLPRYALPRKLKNLESLPLSQLGKVLRHEVRELIMQGN